MEKDRRHKQVNWQLPASNDAGEVHASTVHSALLMDIRDELKKLNGLLVSPNFTGIPKVIRAIARNTAPKKEKEE